MSVQSSVSRISYAGNSSTVTPYVIPFFFLDDNDVVVVVTDSDGADTTLVKGVGYTITGEGVPAGGEIVTASAYDGTNTITIYREVPLTQTTDYQEGGDFPAESHEQALDKLTMGLQQVDREAGRGIKVRESDGERNPLAAIANTIIGLDSSKQPKAMTASEVKTFLALTGVTLDVDAGMKTFADDGERAAAVPDFTGQLGTQRDTNLVYISTGTSAGNWAAFSLSLAMLASGFFTADATGRGKFANAFVNAALLASDAVETAKILDLNVTAGKLAATLDLSSKTLTMPANHWRDIAPAGSVLQVVTATNATEVSASNSIPFDNTIPQSGEGTEIFTASITPFSTSSKILIEVCLNAAAPASQVNSTTALFKDSTTDAFRSFGTTINNSYVQTICCQAVDSPASTSAITYKVRFGTPSGTYYINRYVTGSYYGGTAFSSLILKEIKG